MGLDSSRSVLLAVDLQYDFLPGGALAVDSGDAILSPLFALMSGASFPLVVATQDWHPPHHISFASSHPGRQAFDEIELYGRPQTLWPDHCVQGSPGARLHADLPLDSVALIIRKGMNRTVDSYSAFRNNWDENGRRPATGLAGFLRERGVDEVWVCGLARDFCVLWSAEDAAEAGFSVHVLWDLSRPVDPDSDDRVRASLATCGARIVTGLDGLA
jgi:nicotinamidase/pyrazinamidase